MELIFNFLPWFDRWQISVSEWLAKLEQQLELADVTDNAYKIKLSQICTSQTLKDILGQLPADTTWANAKKEPVI